MAIHVGSFKKVQTSQNEQYNEFNEIIIFHLKCSNSLLLSFLNCQVFLSSFPTMIGFEALWRSMPQCRFN